MSKKFLTDEFKHLLIVENGSEKLSRQIFDNTGFYINILGIKIIKSSGTRWRN